MTHFTQGSGSTQEPDHLDLVALNRKLEAAPPAEILAWAWAVFQPGIAVTSSFQSQSIPLLHLIKITVPQLPIYFLDTGYHFQETLVFRDKLINEWGLTVRSLTPEPGPQHLPQSQSPLYSTDPDRCCYLNKVVPLAQAKASLTAWITGIRRDQTDARRNTPILARERNGQIKICPMATWTERDVWRYINQHDLPVHPLMSQGYMSVGCAPCTRPVQSGEESRAGRWAENEKTECGLHLDLTVEPERQPHHDLHDGDRG